MAEFLIKPPQRDIDNVAETNLKISSQAGAPEPSLLLGGENFEKDPSAITTPFAIEIARELAERATVSRRLNSPDTLEFVQSLPDASIVQLGLPHIAGKKIDIVPVFGAKVPYAQRPGIISQSSIGLLVAADIRGFDPQSGATRFPKNIQQVSQAQPLASFDPRFAENDEHRDMLIRNVQMGLAAGVNKVRAKLGLDEIQFGAKGKHSPVDSTHDPATFQLLSLAARGQQSPDPEFLVHLNHNVGQMTDNVFGMLQQEFGNMTPTVDEASRWDQLGHMYPFPIRLLQVPLSGLHPQLPTEIQFTRNSIYSDGNALYPIDLSPYAAIHDVRSRGLGALTNQSVLTDPESALNRATGGQDFYSLL